MTTLWEKGEINSSTTGVAPANVSSDQPLQGNKADGIASNQSVVMSGDKVSTWSPEKQGDGVESSFVISSDGSTIFGGIIAESIEAEIHTDYTKGKDSVRIQDSVVNNTSLVHRFYGAVNIEGLIYRVKTTMREFRDVNTATNAHSYEVTEIELLEAPSDNTKNSTARPLAMTSNNSIEVAKLLKDIEKCY